MSYMSTFLTLIRRPNDTRLRSVYAHRQKKCSQVATWSGVAVSVYHCDKFPVWSNLGLRIEFVGLGSSLPALLFWLVLLL